VNPSDANQYQDLLKRYGLAFVLAVVALLVRMSLPVREGTTIYQLPLVAVILAGWYGGRGPGLFASLVSWVGVLHFLLPPVNSWQLSADYRLAFAIFIGLCLFITEFCEARWRVEHALQESERRFRFMAETIPEIVWTESVMPRRMLYISPRYEQVWGRSVGDVARNPEAWMEAVHPEHRNDVQSAWRLWLAGEGNGKLDVTFPIIRPDGNTRWIHSRGTLIRDEAGRPYRGSGITADITDEMRAEEARRQAAAEREARRVAELANRAKSQFLSTMSHELRTPLNGILGYAQMLAKDDTLGERQRRGIETIYTSGEHLLSLINDILDLSRIEAGRIELSPTPVEFAAFLRSVADVVQVNADEKALVLAFDAASDLPARILVDERRLRQVLLNLLSNAVKFTEHGTVSLSVSNESRHADHSLVRIEVCDTGVGIAAADLPAIFEPFQQVGDVKLREAGTGLGLTITRALVHAMDGEIDVSSVPGRGSRFSVRLRVKHADVRHPEALAQGSLARYDGHRRRILIIDDWTQNRSMLADFLATAGFESQSAEDGLQGIEMVRSFDPDLVLMDSVMPVMSGLEAIRRLREDPAYAHLPIIAISANAAEDHRQACLQAGANMYMSKPVRLEELAAAIGQLLHCEARQPTV